MSYPQERLKFEFEDSGNRGEIVEITCINTEKILVLTQWSEGIEIKRAILMFAFNSDELENSFDLQRKFLLYGANLNKSL